MIKILRKVMKVNPKRMTTYSNCLYLTYIIHSFTRFVDRIRSLRKYLSLNDHGSRTEKYLINDFLLLINVCGIFCIIY